MNRVNKNDEEKGKENSKHNRNLSRYDIESEYLEVIIHGNISQYMNNDLILSIFRNYFGK